MTVFVSRRRLAQLGVGLLAASTMAVFAQDSYPTKPVRIVVGFSAGGTTDVVARIMAKELTERLGQPFVWKTVPVAAAILRPKPSRLHSLMVTPCCLWR